MIKFSIRFVAQFIVLLLVDARWNGISHHDLIYDQEVGSPSRSCDKASNDLNLKIERPIYLATAINVQALILVSDMMIMYVWCVYNIVTGFFQPRVWVELRASLFNPLFSLHLLWR